MSNSSSFFQDTPVVPASSGSSGSCSSLFQDTNPTPATIATIDTLVSIATIDAQGAAVSAAASAAAAATSATNAAFSATSILGAVTASAVSAAAALASQNAANASQAAAAGSATSASGYATTATGAASTATTGASTATTQATNAGTFATTATGAASTATTQAGNATTQAGNAATSASSASGSASTATTQAGIATTQAGIATTQAGYASTSATNASGSATTATTQAGISTTQAGYASTSATNAASSETNASGSASTATTQAGIATTAATTATNQVTLATAQVALATTQAGNAATSATNALTYSNNAASSATLSYNYATGFTIGTVSVGAASATITGSPGSQHLNLILPATATVTPTAVVLGGLYSSSAGSNQFATGVDTSGNITYAQPSFANLSGAATAAQLPVATTGAQGALPILSGSSTQYLNGVGSWATVTPFTLPVATSSVLGGVKQGTGVTIAGDGTITAAGTYTLPAPTTVALGGIKSSAGTTSQFATGVDTTGAVTYAQPAFTDISGTATAAQLPFPTTSTLGGVKAMTPGLGFMVTGLATTGVFSQAPAPVGFRNHLINGDFKVAQRGTSISCPAGASTYTLDRWVVTPAGSAITATQVNTNELQLTGAAGNTSTKLQQRIEGAHCVDLVGSQVAISIFMKASTAMTVNWDLSYATSPNNFTSLTSISSGGFSVGTGYGRSSAASGTIPAGGANGLVLTLSPASGGAFISGTVNFMSAMLEIGSTYTAFEQRPYAYELALCQRYFEKSWDINVVPGTAYSVGGCAQHQTNLNTGVFQGGLVTANFKVTKRAVPTMVWYSATLGVAGKIQDASNSTDVTATSNTTGQSTASATASLSTGSSNIALYAHWTATAEL